MREDDTLLYVVLAIVILHFIIGIGFLVYKLAGPVKKSDDNIDNKSDDNIENENNELL